MAKRRATSRKMSARAYGCNFVNTLMGLGSFVFLIGLVKYLMEMFTSFGGWEYVLMVSGILAVFKAYVLSKKC